MIRYYITGHRGSGKSTELNKLVEDSEIKNRFFIVKYSIMDILDINNITYIDLLLSIGAKVYITAIDKDIKINESLIKRLDEWKNTIIKRIKIDIEETGVGIDTKLRLFFLSLLGKLKLEHITRTEFHKIVEPRLTELMEIINSIIKEVKTSLPSYKELLIIIDDLEKIPDLKRAKELYRDSGSYLSQPECKIIYTVPISLHYSPEFREAIDRIEAKTYLFPNIPLKHKDGTEDTENFKIMEKFVLNRMDEKLIEHTEPGNALKEAVKYSGGVVREAIRILHACCLKALTKERNVISIDLVRDSVKELRNEFDRILNANHWNVLRDISKIKSTPANELSLELLHILAVIEYTQGERWCDLHPVVEELMKRRNERL